MMNFEDLPPAAQQQIIDELQHEEPAVREAVEADLKRRVKEMQDEIAPDAAVSDEELVKQLRFDKTQAEAADAPLDFAQLYSAVERELDAFKDGEQWQAVTTAAVIQLVSSYCATAVQRNLQAADETNKALSEAIRASEHQLTIEQHKNRELLRENSIAFAVLEAHMDPECVEIITNEQIVKAGRGLNKYRVQIEEQPMMQRVRVTLVQQSDSDV
ncbi:hypothetical protein BARRETLEMON_45 [Arthrobacter phage BarretLemon]|uniref:Uncharacterized protein n=1 Tax=Arthrobacter phage BarretLemon TaxID=1796994 RepID=A0A140G772_9CAUD|nr:hypothetical protein BJD79_gp45 [Arthrobacter phage BarretLemon]AMM44507.1 hypothetical protein BARRETLEMON_45 [Arthrobacter phage BarretLemon]